MNRFLVLFTFVVLPLTRLPALPSVHTRSDSRSLTRSHSFFFTRWYTRSLTLLSFSTTNACFEELKTLVSPQCSFSKLRQHADVHPPPLIPHVGIALSDVTFIEDGNPDYVSADGEPTDLINLVKCTYMARGRSSASCRCCVGCLFSLALSGHVRGCLSVLSVGWAFTTACLFPVLLLLVRTHPLQWCSRLSSHSDSAIGSIRFPLCN
jgi:RasGEF domain